MTLEGFVMAEFGLFIGLDGDPNYDGTANSHNLALYHWTRPAA